MMHIGLSDCHRRLPRGATAKEPGRVRASKIRKLSLLGGYLLFGTLPGIASAQSAGTDTQGTPAEKGDIVVTAQRDRTLASKTPLAITAISGDDLLSKGALDPIQLAKEVPNLEINRYYGLQVTIRGVTNTNMLSSGDPSAAFLLDGVYIARPQAQEASFFDVDRVEVLRGPQGTLYGRNSTAGLINVISKRPTDKLEASGNIGYANYDNLQADIAVNVPVSEKVAFRLAGAIDRRDSFYSNAPGDPYDANPFRNNKSVRLSGKFDFNDAISLVLIGDYNSIRGINQIAVEGSNFYDIAANPDRPVVRDTSASERLQRGYNMAGQPYVNDKTYGITGELTWDMGPVTATYLGSYRYFGQHEDTTDYSGGVAQTFVTGGFKQNSHELRFALNDIDRLKFQFGGVYFQESSWQKFDQPNFYGFDHFKLDYGPTKSTSWALFGQGTYSLLDTLRVTGGLRYTRDTKSSFGWTILESSLFGDSRSLNAASVAFEKVTWRIGADYDLDSRNMLYGSIATGYKAGSYNDGCEDGAVIKGVVCNLPRSRQQLYYNPENLTAYEIGIKGHLASNVLRYSLAAFYYDYTNLQLSTVTEYSGAATTLTQNAATAKIKGIEAELTLRPTPRHQFDAGINYLKGEFGSYQPDPNDPTNLEGSNLARTPRITVNLGYTYTIPLASGASFDIGARVKISDKYYLGVSPQFYQPSYTRTDIQATFHAPGDRWYIQAYGRNLENNVLVTGLIYYNQALTIIPSDPLTYGVRAGFKF